MIYLAIYESIDASVRYPTDFWSGYGFSSSLPADLLKGMLDLNAKEQEKGKGQTVKIFPDFFFLKFYLVNGSRIINERIGISEGRGRGSIIPLRFILFTL